MCRDRRQLIKILHIIIGLGTGGAELMLKRLIESHHGTSYEHSVVSLTDLGTHGQALQEAGIRVQALRMRGVLDVPRVLLRLVRLMRILRPTIVQTWMYHADLLGGLAARMAGIREVVWGVRGSAIPQNGFSVTKLVVMMCSSLSRIVPRAIVCCAEAARSAHIKLGYDKSKMVVIPNGYDVTKFNRSAFRQQSRAAFGYSDNDVVVGIVGRFDPLKDYSNFTRAAAYLASKVANARFLMLGSGIDSKNEALSRWIHDSGYSHRFTLGGQRGDIPWCLAAMDIFCLSSRKEGFPNVVCEAMATELPCVVTNVGDAAEIVADTGIVVAPGDPGALGRALLSMIQKSEAERSDLGIRARQRIEQCYSIQTASTRFEDVYCTLTQRVLLRN